MGIREPNPLGQQLRHDAWGSSIGFSGSWISLISGLGFGILKQNRGEIRDWKFAREVGCQKQPSGLRAWTKFWVGITGLMNPIGDPHVWGVWTTSSTSVPVMFTLYVTGSIQCSINLAWRWKKQITEKIVMKSQSHLGLPASVFLLF